ncbi:hypothetical protein QJQ45_012232 [Haematococcus lacustris]|nr:hypothetical protein QJQ45_012232 [Haematococcus lacustris]
MLSIRSPACSSAARCTTTLAPRIVAKRHAALPATKITTIASDPAAAKSAKGYPAPGQPALAQDSASTRPQQLQVDDFSQDARPVILFDGVCNLCNSAVDLMLELDPGGSFRLAALQSAAGRRLLQRAGRAPDDITSIVLVEAGGAHIKSEAVLRIAQQLSAPWRLLALFGLPAPPFLRDLAYDLVANNRYLILGRRQQCRVMEPGWVDRFLVD